MRGPYGKLRTEVFPSFYGPSAKRARGPWKQGRNRPFHSSWKVTTLFTWNRGEGWVRTVREVEIIDMLISFFLMIIISTSLTVPTQPSPRFHVEAWLPFRNCEKTPSKELPTAQKWRWSMVNSVTWSAIIAHNKYMSYPVFDVLSMEK